MKSSGYIIDLIKNKIKQITQGNYIPYIKEIIHTLYLSVNQYHPVPFFCCNVYNYLSR